MSRPPYGSHSGSSACLPEAPNQSVRLGAPRSGANGGGATRAGRRRETQGRLS